MLHLPRAGVFLVLVALGASAVSACASTAVTATATTAPAATSSPAADDRLVDIGADLHGPAGAAASVLDGAVLVGDRTSGTIYRVAPG